MVIGRLKKKVDIGTIEKSFLLQTSRIEKIDTTLYTQMPFKKSTKCRGTYSYPVMPRAESRRDRIVSYRTRCKNQQEMGQREFDRLNRENNVLEMRFFFSLLTTRVFDLFKNGELYFDFVNILFVDGGHFFLRSDRIAEPPSGQAS